MIEEEVKQNVEQLLAVNSTTEQDTMSLNDGAGGGLPIN
jgi:hypothetical protein